VLIGMVAAACGRRRRLRLYLLALAATVAYLSATRLAGDALLGPLERRYAPLPDASLPRVAYIVVLGSGYEPRDGVPVTGALDADGLARITEGVRLMRRLGGAARLVLSGGALPGENSPAIGYARLARDLGVDDSAQVVMKESLDTHAEANSIAALVGPAPFILVTSAYHMPRAVRWMERAGARPIPAPTGQRVNPTEVPLGSLLPTSGGLSETEHALHEYLGLAALAAGIER
jgi:uncharacterized SAM-binding protein YcdF (DUF218 family)